MPAIVKTNSRLATGSQELIGFTFQTEADNTLSIEAQLLCLPAFADENLAKLRTGSPAPSIILNNVEIIRLLNSLKIQDTPTVLTASAETKHGLTTINLSLGAAIPPVSRVDIGQIIAPNGTKISVTGGEVVILGENEDASGANAVNIPTATAFQQLAASNSSVTYSVDLRSFSGSVYLTEQDLSVSATFDYYASTISVESDGSVDVGTATPLLGEPLNYRGDQQVRSALGQFVSTSYRSTRSANGVYKVQTTSTAYYILNKDTI